MFFENCLAEWIAYLPVGGHIVVDYLPRVKSSQLHGKEKKEEEIVLLKE